MDKPKYRLHDIVYARINGNVEKCVVTKVVPREIQGPLYTVRPLLEERGGLCEFEIKSNPLDFKCQHEATPCAYGSNKRYCHKCGEAY